jgi:hypothetical protein
VWGTVRFGDDSPAKIKGHDKVEFLCKNGECRVFEGVYFIPKLTANIVSVGRLDEDGYEVLIGSSVLSICEPSSKLLAKVQRTARRLYLLNMILSGSATRCMMAKGEAEAWRWHDRLGHLNFPTLKKMACEELVQGLSDIGAVEHPCAACLVDKQKRALHHAEKVLGLMHGDLCSKITPPTAMGNQYFLLLVDDKSHYMSVALLSSKDQATEGIRRFQQKVEAETGQKLGMLRTDRGGEFNSASFTEYYLESGVQHQLTTPYTPQ